MIKSGMMSARRKWCGKGENEDDDIKEGPATGSMLCAGFRTVGPCAESFTVSKQAGDRVSEETKPPVNQIKTHKKLNMNAS